MADSSWQADFDKLKGGMIDFWRLNKLFCSERMTFSSIDSCCEMFEVAATVFRTVERLLANALIEL